MEFHLSLGSPMGKLKERFVGDGERAPELPPIVCSPIGCGDVRRGNGCMALGAVSGFWFAWANGGDE